MSIDRSHEGVTGGLGLATKDVFWQQVPKMLCLLILISKRICYGGVKMQCLLFLYREEVAVIVIIASSISLGVYPSKEQK